MMSDFKHFDLSIRRDRSPLQWTWQFIYAYLGLFTGKGNRDGISRWYYENGYTLCLSPNLEEDDRFNLAKQRRCSSRSQVWTSAVKYCDGVFDFGLRTPARSRDVATSSRACLAFDTLPPTAEFPVYNANRNDKPGSHWIRGSLQSTLTCSGFRVLRLHGQTLSLLDT